MKRLCLNKLPPVLVIQLKRFEYDFEKVCAIKFNDYFEFPRELDVEPYTGMDLSIRQFILHYILLKLGLLFHLLLFLEPVFVLVPS